MSVCSTHWTCIRSLILVIFVCDTNMFFDSLDEYITEIFLEKKNCTWVTLMDGHINVCKWILYFCLHYIVPDVNSHVLGKYGCRYYPSFIICKCYKMCFVRCRQFISILFLVLSVITVTTQELMPCRDNNKVCVTSTTVCGLPLTSMQSGYTLSEEFCWSHIQYLLF